MGYSSRYHVASLAAVFVALAVGIVIGAALGSDVVSGTAESLEQNLSEELDELRADNARLEDALSAERSLGQQLYPVLVGRRLEGENVGVLVFGDVDEGLISAVRGAIEPSGAELAMVAAVREPPDEEALVSAMLGDGRQVLPRPRALALAASRAGAALVQRERRFEAARDALLSRFSGGQEPITAVVVVRDRPEELEDDETVETATVEQGVLDGLMDTGVEVVGAERSDDEPSQIGFFEAQEMSSVDNVDQLAGRFALVLLLGGADGTYGVKETADGLLPELISAADPSDVETP